MEEIIDKFLTDKNITKENSRNKYYFYRNLAECIEGRDLKTLNKSGFIDLMSAMTSRSIQTFYVKKSFVLGFAKWCVENGFMDESQIPAITGVSFDDLKNHESIKRSYIESLDKLIELLETQNEDTEKYDTLICGCYLCWCGIKPNDIVNVEKKDLKDGYILFNGKRYDIADKRVEKFLLKYRDADTYTSDNFGRETEIPYLKTIYLLRSYKNDHITYGMMRTNVSVMSRRIDEKTLSLGKIYESGLFYRAYECEQKGEEGQDKKALLVDFFTKNSTSKNVPNKIKDYSNWKKTFY